MHVSHLIRELLISQSMMYINHALCLIGVIAIKSLVKVINIRHNVLPTILRLVAYSIGNVLLILYVDKKKASFVTNQRKPNID